jgi:uncharacterized protein (TIRG00374 family)
VGEVAAPPPAPGGKEKSGAVSIGVRLLKLLVAVGLMVWLVRGKGLDLQKIAGVLAQPWTVAGVLLLGALNLSTSALRWWLLLRGEGIDCSLGLAWRLTWIGHFWNMVVPGAVSGDAIKMFYIGRAAPSRREEAWTTVFADRVIGMAALVALSTGATLFAPGFMWSRPELRATAVVMFAILLGLIGLGAGLALGVGRESSVADRVRARLAARFPAVMDVLRRGYHSLLRLGQRPRLVALTWLISLWSQSMAVVLCFILGRACGEGALSFQQYCVVVPVALFTNTIPITPGGVGQGELALGKLVEWSGGLASDGVTIMIIYRLMFLAFALVGAILYASYAGGEAPVTAPKADAPAA